MSQDYPERLMPNTDTWKIGWADHIQRYCFAAQWVAGKRVLDSGCGVGYGAAHLAEQGAAQVVAVDISEEALAVARQRFARPNVQFVQDDCQILSKLSEPFDVIVAMESFEHLAQPERFLARCVELLPPTGLAVISTPNTMVLPKTAQGDIGNPYHLNEYTLAEFTELLGNYFDEVQIYHQCKTVALRLRQEVLAALTEAVRLQQSNLCVRLGNWLRRLVRGQPYPTPRFETLRYPREEDYEIRDTVLDQDAAWVFIAVCRKPKREGAG